MSRIFISYRRDDSGGYAGRLYDRLSKRFGQHQIFMDIDTIEPGLDFVEVIEKAVSSCDVLIALIGKQWLTITDANGYRRLDNPEDYVRWEIATALDRNIRVIPVLVGGATMPRSTDLPNVLEKLVRCHALEISSTHFHSDVNRLIETLEEVLGVPAWRDLPIWGWGLIALVAALVIGGGIFPAIRRSEATVTPVPVVQATTPTSTVTVRATPMSPTAILVTQATTPALTKAPTAIPILPTASPTPTATKMPTQTPAPPTATTTHTLTPTVTPTSTTTNTPTPVPTVTPQSALTIYLRRTETDFTALSEDQANAGIIYEEWQFVYGEAAVRIGDTVYHFDKKEEEIGPGEPRQLPDPWRVEFEFAEELVARTGNQAGFDPKKAQFWAGTLDGNSAVGEDSPYSLMMKLYEGDELRESIQVFFAVADAPESPGPGSGDGGKPPPP